MSEMAVRVLPVPVACTNNALRRPLLQRFADRPDCPLLVVAPGDAVRKGDLGKGLGLADLPAPDQGL